MMQLSNLVSTVEKYFPNVDLKMIEKAFLFSQKAHDGQKRKSGDPYFTHPLSVANILAELRLDTASICAGLLHDVVEDTLCTTSDIEKEFGSEIAFLVDGVTKLSKVNFTSKEDRQAENFRKMLVAMAADIRVLVVKLCDRLDNMRTLEHMKSEAQDRIALETLEIFAPLANRLGIGQMKSELEDLSFKYLEPASWSILNEKLSKSENERDRYIAEVSQLLHLKLNEHGLEAEVSGRAKHLYSIWRKMQSQNCDFEQVYDVIAFRAIVETIGDCYAALGTVHSQWTPVPGRFKDYIALPKPNMYQSLHTTMIGPGGERFEIQIRTRDMDRVAEQGIAAHWQYKERHTGGMDPKDVAKFGWLKQLMEFQKDLKDPAEFLESVKVDLFQDEVYVFTPKGDVFVFPQDASPIDFAFAIHSKVGLHCSGAKVNGVIVPLRSKLNNGDVVEVLTNPSKSPSKDWLDYVVTGRARSRIRAYLRAEQRDRSIKLGKELLEKELHQQGMSFAKLFKNDAELKRLLERFGYSSTDEFLAGVGYGKTKIASVIEFLAPVDSERGHSVPPPAIKEGKMESLVRKMTGKSNQGIVLSGIDDILVRYTKCCNPLPGDEIIGFISRGRGVTVHRRNCTKALDSDPERRVEISWDSSAKINRAVQVRVVTANRPGILATVGQTFHEQGININEATCRTTEEGRAVNVFTFLCTDLNQLKNVSRKLQKIQGVVSVERI